MDTLQERLHARKLKFLAKCRERIEAVRQALRKEPPEATELSDSHKNLHQMAGAAGIYELDELAQAAIACEDACARLLAATDEAAIAELARLLTQLQSLVEAADAGA